MFFTWSAVPMLTVSSASITSPTLSEIAQSICELTSTPVEIYIELTAG